MRGASALAPLFLVLGLDHALAHQDAKAGLAVAKSTAIEQRHQAKSKTKDDGNDDGDGGGVTDVMGAMDAGGPGGIMGAMQAQLAVKTAQERHDMMHQFMHNFARNMRYAVLEDSKGDLPEGERLELMHKIEAEGPVAQNPADRQGQPRRPHHRRMLNREGPQAPPAHHVHMLNGMSAKQIQTLEHGGGAEAAKIKALKQRHAQFMQALSHCPDEECIQRLYAIQAQERARERNQMRAPAPVRNQPREEDDQDDAAHSESAPVAASRGWGADAEIVDADDPPATNVQQPTLRVRDAMGRAMPLLFGGRSPATPQKSGATAGSAVVALFMIVMAACNHE